MTGTGLTLPRGATGFDAAEVDAGALLRTFASFCHQAARAVSGTVLGVTSAGVTPSFHKAEVRVQHRDVAVLRHVVLPFVAFRDAEGFVDHPGLAAAITSVSELRILTRGELETPLSRVDLSGLGREEHDQIAYWQPGTVGDLLFNDWD